MNQPSPEAQLDSLLSEDLAAARERETTAFEKAAGPFSKELVLFGAGHLGRRTLSGLRSLGIEPLAFADNDERLWGRAVDDVTVLSPEEAARRFGRSAAFVVTIWRGEGTDRMGARCEQLEELGCQHIVPFGFLYFRHPEVFLPHYALDLPHRVLEQADAVRQAFGLFTDPASRAEYLAQIRWRLLLDFDCLPDPVSHEIYFPEDLFTLGPDEVFVDCGAFDGDTLRRFLFHRGTSFRRVEAFEPDPGNLEKLRSWVLSLPADVGGRFRVHGSAVGATRGTVRFNAMGNEASFVGSGDLEIPSVALDEALDVADPTYLKMDTEGSELDALVGSQKLLARARPALAICSYHLQDHLWRVPLLIAQAAPNYRFFLRPQLLEVWDLVCYAVPEERLRK